MPAPHDPRALPPAAHPEPADRPFPPVITYRALEGQPALVRLVVATAVLPLEITVSGVRTLHALESVLVELAAHLRALRPAVSAASDAYAAGRFDPVFRTIDRFQHGTDAFAVVWSPIATVREVIVPSRGRPSAPAAPTVAIDPVVRERIAAEVRESERAAARGWFSWLPGR